MFLLFVDLEGFEPSSNSLFWDTLRFDIRTSYLHARLI